MHRSCPRFAASTIVTSRIAALILGAVVLSSLDACEFLSLGNLCGHLSFSCGPSQDVRHAGSQHHEVSHVHDDPSMLAFSFAGHDCIENFIVQGIGRDYASTAAHNKALRSETTLGGDAQALGNSLWGFVVKPTGRVVVGGIGAAVGAIAGTITGICALGTYGSAGEFGKNYY
jgi:hypothetical protein